MWYAISVCFPCSASKIISETVDIIKKDISLQARAIEYTQKPAKIASVTVAVGN